MRKSLLFLFFFLALMPFLVLLVGNEVSLVRQMIGSDGKITLTQYVASKKLGAQPEGVKITWDNVSNEVPFMVEGFLAKREAEELPIITAIIF